MILVDGICLEETESCGEDPEELPFKFRYLFRKDPCKDKKCLVRAACNTPCEIKREYWKQGWAISRVSITLRKFVDKFFDYNMIALTILMVVIGLLMLIIHT